MELILELVTGVGWSVAMCDSEGDYAPAAAISTASVAHQPWGDHTWPGPGTRAY